MKKSIGKAMNNSELEHAVNDFDFKNHNMTNITINSSYLRQVLKNKFKNNSMNISNMSAIRNHLDKTELAGFSKLGEMDLMMRPSRLNRNRNMITKNRGSFQTEKKQILENTKDQYSKYKNPQIISVGREKLRHENENKNKKAPIIFRQKISSQKNTISKIKTQRNESKEEFNTFTPLKDDVESYSSEEMDSFDREKEKRDKEISIREGKVFEFGISNPNQNNENLIKNKKKRFGDDTRTSFQSYYKIDQVQNTEDDEEDTLRPMTGKVKLQFHKQKSNSNMRFNQIPKQADKLRMDDLDVDEEKYEKVNIYKDSVYQQNINRYLERSRKNISTQNNSEKSSKKEKFTKNSFNPMKPDTNEELMGKEIRSSKKRYY